MIHDLKIIVKAASFTKGHGWGRYHVTSNSVHTFMRWLNTNHADWKFCNVFNEKEVQIDYWTNPAPGAKDFQGNPKLPRWPSRPYVVPSGRV